MNSKSKLFVNPHGRLCEFKIKNKETMEAGCFVLNCIKETVNEVLFAFEFKYISKHQKW